MKQLCIFGAIPACCLAAAAFAGSVIELETTDHSRQPPEPGTIEITTEGGSTRMEIGANDGGDSGGFIYSSERGAMIALDHGRKEYFVMDKQQVESMADQMGQAMKQMEEALAQMPPEQRAMAKQMMKSRMPAPQAEESRGTLHRRGESDTVAGYDCDYYEVRKGGRKSQELCVASWSEFPEGRQVAASMRELAKFVKNMSASFTRSGGPDFMSGQEDMFGYMEELDGYPVLSRDYSASGELEAETMLKSASQQDVDSSMFDPPEGYRQNRLR